MLLSALVRNHGKSLQSIAVCRTRQKCNSRSCFLPCFPPTRHGPAIRRSSQETRALSTAAAKVSPPLCSGGRLHVHVSRQLSPALLLARPFSRSSPRPLAFPPAVWFVIRPVTKFLAVLFGRSFRKWWRALPDDKRAVFRASLRRNWRRIAALSAAVAALSLHYYYTHVQECVYTGRRRFLAFTPEQIEQISREQFDQECEMYGGGILPADHEAYSLVVRVANRLLGANCELPQIHGKDWSVTVVHNDAINAYVLPCGNIFVFTGMLEFCHSEDQLGCVLGHEMAHAILGHGAERVSRAHLIDLLLILPLAAIWALLPSDGISVVTHWFFRQMVTLLLDLPHSRELETEADEIGQQLAAKACFDVREASAFWGKMAVKQELDAELDVAWLSTHPAHDERQQSIEGQLPAVIKTREGRKCCPLPARDPRASVEEFRRKCKAEVAAAADIPKAVRLAPPPPPARPPAAGG